MNKKNYNPNKLTSQLEEIVKQKEALSIIISELRLLYKSQEYSEIKSLIFEKTHDNWVCFKNLKSELDSIMHIGLPNYKFEKNRSILASTETYIKYLESIQKNQNKLLSF